ncbi:polypeptide N-acetylgalactosaminyltransferase [Bacillus freudenreichii]|nr:polypeptide N-acetylgalactosaminyltransferase [Bacillus freudenreichii]
MNKISIIFPVKNEGVNVKNTLDSLFSKMTNYSFDVIVVNDASTDQCCDFIEYYSMKDQIHLIETNSIGPANARNAGAEIATGDYLIFCDAHLEFEDSWIDRMLEPLLAGKTDAISPAIGSIGNESFIGYGQSLKPNLRIKWNPEPGGLCETAILPGACLAIKKTTFEKVGGFESGFLTWGHEDVELSIKLWLFGYRCHVLPTVKILHLFRKKHPYLVKYEDIYYNYLRMSYLHFNAKRILSCKRLILHTKARDIELRVLYDGALEQRKEYFKRRVKSDDWYFNKFKIDF